MEDNDMEILDPVDGLVDAEHVSKYLGVDKITLRSWVLRKKKGDARGIHDRFPDPRGTLGTSVVWRADAIIEFKQFYTERKSQKGVRRAKVVDEKGAEVTPLKPRSKKEELEARQRDLDPGGPGGPGATTAPSKRAT